MKKLRWQLIIIFITGLIVGVLLIIEQPVSILSAEPAPARGGIYSEALVGSMQRLNPVLDYYNAPDRDINRLIYSGLVRFDARGVPIADLAESWGVSKDGTIYNFTLRANAEWHDGQPVTSDDVLFTIEMIRGENPVIPADLRAFWQEVDVIGLNEHNLQFRLPEPFAPFLDYLSFGVLPAHLLGGMTFEQMIDDPFNMAPVGSGPYRFDRLVVENGNISGVVLSAFDDYYREKPFIEQIIFRFYPDDQAAYNAYREGEVQGIGTVGSGILNAVLAEPRLSVYTGRKPELAMVLFNLKNPEAPFLEEVEVRQALMQAINRQWLVDRVLNGQAILANGPILPGTWAYYDGLASLPFDTQQARAILKQAGYVIPAEGSNVREKEGEAIRIELLHPDDELHTAIAESIQRDWELLEIGVDLVALPYDELVSARLDNRDYEAALVDLNLSRAPDPDPYPFWDQAEATGGQNYTQWDSRSASEYIEQARVSIDLSERERLYRNFQVIFNDEVPAIPLYYPVYTYAVDSQVQGVQMGPLFDNSDRFATVNNWFIVSSFSAAEETPASPDEP